MRISELARLSGVGVPTIKFYLREGLLQDGVLTSPTQAQYDDTHVARLRLVRALLGPGGLSVVAVQGVLQAIENPPESTHDLLGIAHDTVNRPPPKDRDLSEVYALLARWQWHIDERDVNSPAALADALDGLDAAGFELPAGALDGYAAAMYQVAEAEIEGVPTESAVAAVRYVILGTVLVEPLLLALRRLAQQDASVRKFGHRGW